MQRHRPVVSWLLLALVAVVLTAESWLPGNVLVPLTPDDFPTWAAGRGEDELARHEQPNWTMSDVLHLLVPGLATTRAALNRGELPLWDPSQALGLPHLDQIHYSVLYPPAWIPLALGLVGLGILAAVHLLVASTGTWLYLRSLGRSPYAALLGAVAFGTSAWITARLQAFPVVGAAVWLPWMLWGLQAGAREGGFVPRIVTALAVALSLLAGMPQITLLCVLTVVFIEGARFLTAPLRRRKAFGPALAGLGAGLLGVALAAPQVLPTLEYLDGESLRAEQDVQALATECLHPNLLKHLVAPDYYANAALTGLHPLALGDVPGSINPVLNNRAESSMGIGVLGLILALVAMLFGRTFVTRTWSVLVLGLFAVLCLPEAFVVAAEWLPPLRFGSPRRLLVITSFGLAVLAAGGFDLVRTHRMRVTASCWAFSLMAVAGALVLVLSVPSVASSEDVDNWAYELAGALGMPVNQGSDVYPTLPYASFVAASDAAFRSCIIALVVAGAAVMLFRPRALPTLEGWTTLAARRPLLLVSLVCLELVLTGRPLLRPADAEAVTTDASRLDRLRVPALVSAVRATTDDGRVPVRLGRVGNDPSWLRPNFPGLFGLHDVQAYAPMVPRRVAELLRSFAPETGLTGSRLGGFAAESLESPLVDMLGISAVMTHDDAVAPAGMTETERVGHVRVLRNDEALARAWAVPVDGVRHVPEEGAMLVAMKQPGFDPRAEVLLADELSLPADEPGGPPSRSVEVLDYAPGALRIKLGPGPPGVLVVSETWHPRWTAAATYGGGQLEDSPEVRVANHALIAVPVPTELGGVITLSLDDTPVQRGLLVSGGGLVAALGALLISARRRRRGDVVVLEQPDDALEATR